MSEKVKIATIEFTAEEWESVKTLAQKKNKKADLTLLTPPNVLRLAVGLETKKRGGARENTGNRTAKFHSDVDHALLNRCKRQRIEMTAMHGHLNPLCDGGCPADVHNQAMVAAIARAEAPKPRWNADLNGDLRAALADVELEISQMLKSLFPKEPTQ